LSGRLISTTTRISTSQNIQKENNLEKDLHVVLFEVSSVLEGCQCMLPIAVREFTTTSSISPRSGCDAIDARRHKPSGGLDR
jgi:hypothetical protein